MLQRLSVQDLNASDNRTPLRTELGLVRPKDRTPTPASNILMKLVRSEARQKLIGR